MMLVMCGPMIFKRNRQGARQTDQSAELKPESNEVAELREEVALLKAKLAIEEQERESEPRS